jgi:hypothetical protein
MLCLSNNHDPSWMRYGSRSKAQSRRHCLGARWPRPATTCLPCGIEYPELELSNDLAWRRTQRVP